MLYGGIDSKEVTERATDPSGAMGAIQRIMSNDVACKHVARDFARPASERRLFAARGADRHEAWRFGRRSDRRDSPDRSSHLHEKIVLGRAGRRPIRTWRSTAAFKLFADIVAGCGRDQGLGSKRERRISAGKRTATCARNGGRPATTRSAPGAAVVTYLLRRSGIPLRVTPSHAASRFSRSCKWSAQIGLSPCAATSSSCAGWPISASLRRSSAEPPPARRPTRPYGGPYYVVFNASRRMGHHVFDGSRRGSTAASIGSTRRRRHPDQGSAHRYAPIKQHAQGRDVQRGLLRRVRRPVAHLQWARLLGQQPLARRAVHGHRASSTAWPIPTFAAMVAACRGSHLSAGLSDVW